MIVFFNPLSTTPGKQPLPISVLSLAAALGETVRWDLIDGNLHPDPAAGILTCLADRRPDEPALLAVTVMPGPQVRQAVAVCRRIRAALPGVPIVWGGYFPTQHADVVLQSPLVDFVIRGQGEQAFMTLLDALRFGGALSGVSSLSWKRDGRIAHNPVGPVAPLDSLPDLPYARVPMPRYLHRNYLGERTVAYNSSFGCPFACGFCAVGAMTRRRWVAQSARRMAATLAGLAGTYGVDAVQMHDMDFFISEGRASEFAERITPLGLRWWGLGRVDLLMQYSDATWRSMQRSGLKMIFSGAEAASDAQLAAMNKGGKASAGLTLELAARMREYGIVPEFSFVLGAPPDPLADLDAAFGFIRRLKRINPEAEVVLYTYAPVPHEGNLYAEARRGAFAFPQSLDEWASPRWERFAMRRGDHLPWIDRRIRRRVRNFERVVNAYYPTVTDARLSRWHRTALRAMSGWRYALQWYHAPYELRALHRLMRYQRPETTGF